MTHFDYIWAFLITALVITAVFLGHALLDKHTNLFNSNKYSKYKDYVDGLEYSYKRKYRQYNSANN
jgi:hypothetical protein